MYGVQIFCSKMMWSMPKADAFAATPTASVATVVLGLPPDAVRRVPALRANGLLVPSAEGSLLKASTFLSNKWAHLEDPDVFWLRMSAGRAFDDRLAALDDDRLVDHRAGAQPQDRVVGTWIWRLHDDADPAGLHALVTMEHFGAETLGRCIVGLADADLDRQTERLTQHHGPCKKKIYSKRCF